MTPSQPSAVWGFFRILLSILMLLIGLALLAPGLLCLVTGERVPSSATPIYGVLFFAALIGLLIVFVAIRLMMPRRHG
ncbi:hypothetical protein ACQR1I_21645 [Bradyrhizobium sp. HKCCYLS2038]|uniref:hypothetical protein n=1 Tax=unclassified Bradyrhizobium TaxID=2631580 RepID=UPI003EBF5E43